METQKLRREIRLAAGVGLWLMERSALGRFFIGDDEISLVQGDGGMSFLESLARIPPSSLLKSGNGQKLWAPAARPLGPVLRLGLFATEDPLVHKQVVLDVSSKASGDFKNAVADNVLTVNALRLERSFETSRETEVSL